MRLFLFMLALTAGLRGAAASRPDFGLIFNDDADLAFVDPDRTKAEALLRANVASWGGSGIRTFVFCVGMGGDVLYYPTKVASRVGWRKSPDEVPGSPIERRIAVIRACLDAGADAVRTAGEAARAAGLRFIPSLRMNDAHFMVDPDRHPMTSEFWFRHRAEYTIRDSPLGFQAAYGNLLDYTHAAVRQLRLDTVQEVLDRNRDLVDGFELDFNRFQVFFPRGRAAAGAPLISDLVREVRRRLDVLSREVGRPLHLFVRVPPSLADCRWAGLEVERWIREGWVDLVSPAQLMTLAGDMPIADLVAVAREHGVRVQPSLYPRTSWRIPFPAPGAARYAGAKVTRDATLDEIRGAADAYAAMGVNGFYLFNFTTAFGSERPPADAFFRLTRDLSHPGNLGLGARVQAVTKTYYHDGPGSYAYAKALPVRVRRDAAVVVDLAVGTDPWAGSLPAVAAELRVGVRGLPATGKIGLRLNGREIGPSALRIDVRDLTGANPRQADAAEAYLHFKLAPESGLRAGGNEIELRLEGTAEATVTDVELRSDYRQTYELGGPSQS